MAEEAPPIDEMQYEKLAQDALRGVIRSALERAASPSGIPGAHHFYITFKTRGPGVSVPPDVIAHILRACLESWRAMGRAGSFETGGPLRPLPRETSSEGSPEGGDFSSPPEPKFRGSMGTPPDTVPPVTQMPPLPPTRARRVVGSGAPSCPGGGRRGGGGRRPAPEKPGADPFAACPRHTGPVPPPHSHTMTSRSCPTTAPSPCASRPSISALR